MDRRLFRILTGSAAVCRLVAPQLGAQEVIYAQDFEGFSSGTTNLGDGSVMTGSANIVNGELQMTTNNAFVLSAFWIPPAQVSADGWVAEFDYSITDAAQRQPADGFSFNYGSVPPGVLSSMAEEGFPGIVPIISFEVDTWQNGTPEVGPAISVNNVDIPGGFINGDMLADDTSISGSIQIILQQDGTTSFTSTGALTNAAFRNLASGFTLDGSFAFAIAARTGGASQEVRIDNLRIISMEIPDPVNTIEPISSIELIPAGLRLTIPTARGRRIGIEYSPDLTPGSWIELGNFFADGGDPDQSVFTDPDLTRLARRTGFYRAFLREIIP